MQIRRKTFRAYIDSKVAVKSLALLFYVKHHFKSSVIKNFSYNKLHKMTGLHINTLKLYIKTLRQMGLAVNIGKKAQSLLLKGDYSHDKRKNVNLDALVYDSVKTVAYSLYAMFVVEEQRRHDYANHVILTTENATKETPLDVLKKALRLRKGNGYGKVFKDSGIAYYILARRLRVHTQKAIDVIKFACKYNFLVKYNHCLWEQCDDAFLRVKCGVDYVWAKVFEKLDNFGNIIDVVFGLRAKANTYSVGSRLADTLPSLTNLPGIV